MRKSTLKGAHGNQERRFLTDFPASLPDKIYRLGSGAFFPEGDVYEAMLRAADGSSPGGSVGDGGVCHGQHSWFVEFGAHVEFGKLHPDHLDGEPRRHRDRPNDERGERRWSAHRGVDLGDDNGQERQRVCCGYEPAVLYR